jgi:ABC-type amino acid transport substrate-binding protein
MNTIPTCQRRPGAPRLLALCRSCRCTPARCSTACKAASAVRVCIWPDYYGITFRNPRTQQLGGIDVDLSAEFGRDLKAKLEYVDSSFPRWSTTSRPTAATSRCSPSACCRSAWNTEVQRPYLQSDIYGVATKGNRVVSASGPTSTSPACRWPYRPAPSWSR